MKSTQDPNRDSVRLHEEGWKHRYYLTKLHVNIDVDQSPLLNLCRAYAEGLSWVYSYYYRGCVSWSWYYPYHYAPFASDLINLEQYDLNFELSKPFSPLAQLMGVLPPDSSHALPKKFATLMCDPKSKIADFYPLEFEIDLDGKRHNWSAIALLPFIDETRLLEEIAPLELQLGAVEKKRNAVGHTYIFTHNTTLLGNTLFALYDSALACEQKLWSSNQDLIRTIMMNVNAQTTGLVRPYSTGNAHTLPPPLTGLPSLKRVTALSALYELPPFRDHICEILAGARQYMTRPSLTDEDMQPVFSSKRFAGISVVQRVLQQSRNGEFKRLERFLSDGVDHYGAQGNSRFPDSVRFGYQNNVWSCLMFWFHVVGRAQYWEEYQDLQVF